MIDRIRIIRNDGSVTVQDYAFSQTVEMLSGLSRQQRTDFDAGVETTLVQDTVFARKGERAKLVRS